MALVNSHNKKKRKLSSSSAAVGGSSQSEASQKKSNHKRKKDDSKKKILPPLVEGRPFVVGHRIFGIHAHTNQLRPCEVIMRRAIGSIESSQSMGNSADAEDGLTKNNFANGNSRGKDAIAMAEAAAAKAKEARAVANTAKAALKSALSSGGNDTQEKEAAANAAEEAAKNAEEAAEESASKLVYEYYVHFLELNRRNDCWLQVGSMQIKDEDGNLAPTVEVGANSAIAVRGRKNVEFVEEAMQDKNEGMDDASLREHEEVTKVKNVEMIELGQHRMETWYFSPYPPELFPNKDQQTPISILYICEFTLDFFKHKAELRRHYQKNPMRHPPGNEIYRDPDSKLSMFEVDGAVQQKYCQNLCWLGKLFLDHKTLYYDVDPFMFYVLCEFDDRGYHIVGFYSKEKLSEMGYNLACILTLPAYQRKGYGKFLIEFSYALSKIEGKVGSPEKPLSDLGQLAYYPYWEEQLLQLLADSERSGAEISIMEICNATSFKPDDVLGTLQRLNLLRYHNGQHVLYLNDEAKRLHNKNQKKRKTRKKPRVKPELIHWIPIVEYGAKTRDKWAFTSKQLSSIEGIGMEDENFGVVS